MIGRQPVIQQRKPANFYRHTRNTKERAKATRKQAEADRIQQAEQVQRYKEDFERTLVRDAAESKKLTNLLDESRNFNEGRTRRSVPLKKIAEIRKA